jgi:MFS transporter, OCT family, solute carrier family 22 (organic cation transporter), member 4/5
MRSQLMQASAEEKSSMAYYMTQPDIRINLSIMTCVWLTGSFNYYLVSFLLKYFPGSIYHNSTLSGISEVVSIIFSGVIYKRLGVKLCLILFFAIAMIGGFAICFFYAMTNQFDSTQEKIAVPEFVFPALVLIAKFGISAAFNVAYLANADVFPALFCGSALGLCNFTARIATMFAPMVAEIQSYTPMVLFSVTSFITCLAATQLRLEDAQLQQPTDQSKSPITTTEKSKLSQKQKQHDF